MAVKSVDLKSAERVHLVRPQPEPVHPRVDHHVAGPIRRNLLPARDLLRRVEHRPRRQAERGLDVIRADAVKHDQARVRRQVAKLLRLRPGRDEEVAAARLDQRLRGLARA